MLNLKSIGLKSVNCQCCCTTTVAKYSIKICLLIALRCVHLLAFNILAARGGDNRATEFQVERKVCHRHYIKTRGLDNSVERQWCVVKGIQHFLLVAGMPGGTG
jgi:hypothetical protein